MLSVPLTIVKPPSGRPLTLKPFAPPGLGLIEITSKVAAGSDAAAHGDGDPGADTSGGGGGGRGGDWALSAIAAATPKMGTSSARICKRNMSSSGDDRYRP